MTVPDPSALARGHSLEREVMAALGALPGVCVHRNPKGKARLPSGATVTLGIAGDGAPDIMAEVLWPTPEDPFVPGVWVTVWMECKSGEFARLKKDQREWFAAARRLNRHAYVVRSVDHARAIVESFKKGEVFHDG